MEEAWEFAVVSENGINLDSARKTKSGQGKGLSILAPIFISILAIIFSALSYMNARDALKVSEKSLELAQKQFDSKFDFIWNVKISGSGPPVLFFEEFEESWKAQEVLITFPALAGGRNKGLPMFRKEVPISDDLREINEYLIDKVTTPQDFVGGVLMKVPVVVHTYATVEGAKHQDKSIYVLEVEQNRRDRNSKKWTLSLRGFSFSTRLELNVPPDAVLDDFVKTYDGKLWLISESNTVKN